MCKNASLTFLVLTILFIFIWSAHAAELDSVTPRGIELEDGVGELNRIINKRLQEGVGRANQKQLSDVDETENDEFCDEEILYDSLRRTIFRRRFPGEGSLKGYALDKQLRALLDQFSYALPLELSIMRDWTYWDGYSLKLKGLTNVMNANGHLIGLDKFGHFFAEGWSYFKRLDVNGDGVREAMEWGIQKEKGKFGYATTGVFSYADLVANFNGMRFWNHVLLRNRDPLRNYLESLFDRAYVKCEYKFIKTIAHLHRQDWNWKEFKMVKAWKINRRFDAGDYLDGTWDEGVNCNSYASPDLEEKLANRIQQIDPNFQCPLEPIECLEAKEKYGRFAKKILHPNCLMIHASN